ncbi:very-long-chain (3R)-3-hydroxyacyl-CoA dehydratase 2 [Asparagus officinalis]|uniref:very-long-chain (3R)-3-hydroxyacyl-CoA dehydratase 2 n=1 Tax=Asparagus officinalis TaxID=4686 RepID=UPI00098E40BD|nr:very-long-chain (3R)-3-hydroxyacyl-CoA dehydratase 2 [Asparagus officinalis]
MARPSMLYLFSYNSPSLSFGWSLALCKIVGNLITTSSIDGTYASAGDLICILQTISFLEVMHAAIGLVPSGVLLALMQWGGRTHFLLAIVRQIVEVQELPSVFITFMSWSISEVVRYSHYATSCIGICPSWLTYFRYTLFIPLYPIGVAPGEMWLMYQALPFIKDRNLYSKVFDKLPFSYYSFVMIVLVFYPILWSKLYLHLFKQRRSKLKNHQKKKKI